MKSVDVSLENQVVRILGSTTVKDLTAALAESGRKARLIGQGLPESKLQLVDLIFYPGSVKIVSWFCISNTSFVRMSFSS